MGDHCGLVQAVHPGPYALLSSSGDCTGGVVPRSQALLMATALSRARFLFCPLFPVSHLPPCRSQGLGLACLSFSWQESGIWRRVLVVEHHSSAVPRATPAGTYWPAALGVAVRPKAISGVHMSRDNGTLAVKFWVQGLAQGSAHCGLGSCPHRAPSSQHPPKTPALLRLGPGSSQPSARPPSLLLSPGPRPLPPLLHLSGHQACAAHCLPWSPLPVVPTSGSALRVPLGSSPPTHVHTQLCTHMHACP